MNKISAMLMAIKPVTVAAMAKLEAIKLDQENLVNRFEGLNMEKTALMQ